MSTNLVNILGMYCHITMHQNLINNFFLLSGLINNFDSYNIFLQYQLDFFFSLFWFGLVWEPEQFTMRPKKKKKKF